MDVATYAEAKAARVAIEADVARLSAALRDFPKGAMGLTPDAVKASPEYITASAAFNIAFQRLRTLNATFVKAFAKEISAERVARHRERAT